MDTFNKLLNYKTMKTLKSKQKYYLTFLINRYKKCIDEVKDMDIVPQKTISRLTGFGHNGTCILCKVFKHCTNCPHNNTSTSTKSYSCKEHITYKSLNIINSYYTYPIYVIEALNNRIEYLTKLRNEI